MSKKRVFSGIRATGRLHLGNYLGAVKGMLALQDDPKYETYFSVVDLHTITTPYNPKVLSKDCLQVVLDYLAAGLDPKKSTILIQSHIPEHIELSYLFSTQVSVARMSHLPTFKEKVKLHPNNVTMALLNYPILMAADILIYKADSVPVGDDQLPHLEIAREIARKMNANFSLNFPEPKQFRTKGFNVPSLVGEGKMSKSIEGSYINLTDDLDTIRKKLASAPTDSGKGDKVPNKGGVYNLLTLVELFEGEKKRGQYEKKYKKEGISYKDLKEDLAKAIFKELKPIQQRRKKFEKDTRYVGKVLEEGRLKAQKEAQKTLQEVKKGMGLTK